MKSQVINSSIAWYHLVSDGLGVCSCCQDSFTDGQSIFFTGGFTFCCVSCFTFVYGMGLTSYATYYLTDEVGIWH